MLSVLTRSWVSFSQPIFPQLLEVKLVFKGKCLGIVVYGSREPPPNNSYVVIDLDNSSGRLIDLSNSSGPVIDLNKSSG